MASACNHRVPSDRADLEQIIEDYRNKANSMKSVQSVNVHDIYGNHSVLQKQSVSHHCTSPITMHISMPHSPPYHGTRSPVPYMHHRTPSPGPQTQSPYMQHSTLSPGHQSPVWHSSAGNVNYRWQNASSVRNRSPHYYSTPRRGHHQRPQQTHFNQSTCNYRKRQHDHDHLSKKKLQYHSKSRGRNFRESLNVVTETKTATKIGSDDETQDDSLTESPAPKTSSKGEVSSAVLVEDNGESQSLNEESQSFNYESWEKEQIAVARKIAGTDT